MRRALRWALAALAVALALGLAAYGFLRGSAPRLDGRVSLAGLSAPVSVTRDALGVPAISGANRRDVMRVLGYLHAQDRFFQMDLMRRVAAGELSELVGKAAVDFDKQHRLFRLRSVAREVLNRATPTERAALDAYTDGVNAGLKDLGTWPFEYGVLMKRPRPWTSDDSVLVIYAMYFDLQDARDRRESDLAVMRDVLPPTLFRFLTAPGTQWDAPLFGKAVETPPIPASDVIDLAKLPPFAPDALGPENDVVPGSNNWAVSAAHGEGGHALLANDMHLGLRVPNIWYRAQLNYTDANGVRVRVTGVTLPGVGTTVAGSNGHVAWGYTNSYGDWVDLVMLRLNPTDPDQYLAPDGWRQFSHQTEVIHVKGHRDQILDVRGTIWGPVLDQDHDGVLRAVHWMAADPDATNFELADLESAHDVHEALATANRAGMPEQNFVTADADGHIAWTIAGRIPVRNGYDPGVPFYWDKPGVGWSGWLAYDKYPRIVDPPEGRLWTANARTTEGAMLTLIGDGGYDLGARAHQIHDDLMKRDKFNPAAMLAIQLDDEAVFLARWRSLLLRLLNPQAVSAHPQRDEFRRAVDNWGGHAAVDSVGYRLVRAFRLQVEHEVMTPILAPCVKADGRFRLRSLTQIEGPLWALVSQRPANLLNPRYADWDALMLAAVDRVSAELWEPESGFRKRVWGERNTVRIRHPLSAALPFPTGFLDMAPAALPGDSNMPRVQGMDFGPSERMVVAPGHEENGIFEMPAGQSAWPLSPYYRNSEPAWEHGDATPFLPGAAQHTLEFQPTD